MKRFIDKSATIDTFWRSIILLGNNVASYKFALGKTLINLSNTNTEIKLDEIALPFAKHVCEHLKKNPKQITSSSSQFLDYCSQFNQDEISEDQLKEKTIQLGFNNVIDAFHNVRKSEVPRFFKDQRQTSKGIILTDNFFKLKEIDRYQNLQYEIESRWRLWETAISMKISPNLLQIHTDEDHETLFIIDEHKRIDVTSAKNSLNGYQKGKCFYCRKDISIESGHENSCDVDHFFPHILLNYGLKGLNQVWNLVLSCKECNRGSAGKFERIPDISFLDQLYVRNNYFIESHHPLRETIINQTGNSEEDRISFLQSTYDLASSNIPSQMKWKPYEVYGEQL